MKLFVFFSALFLATVSVQAHSSTHRALWVCQAVAYHRIPGLSYSGWGSYASSREVAYASAMSRCRQRAGNPLNCRGWGCVLEVPHASMEFSGLDEVSSFSEE